MKESVESKEHLKTSSYGSTQCSRYPQQPVIEEEYDSNVSNENNRCNQEESSFLLSFSKRNVNADVDQDFLIRHKKSFFKYASLSFCALAVCTFLTSYKEFELNPITSLFHKRSSYDEYELLPAMDIVYEDTDRTTRQDSTISLPSSSTTKKEITLPMEQLALLRDHESVAPPFSTYHPVKDLNVLPFDRPKFSTPGKVFGEELHKGQRETGHALPTNKWYENMFLLADQQIAPDDSNRVYTVPYVISANGPVPGIKLQSTRLLGMDRVVQVTFVDHHGITLGAAESFDSSDDSNFGRAMQKKYVAFDDHIADDDHITNDDSARRNHTPLTPLGFTIKWEPNLQGSNLDFITSSVVRGMPYGTMKYKYKSSDGSFDSIFPTVVSQIQLYSPPLADSKNVLVCSKGRNSTQNDEHLVEKSIQITFLESDVTWLIFYSHPVYVRCYDLEHDTTATPFVVQATRLANASAVEEDDWLVSRVALMNNCTIGANPSHCKNGKPNDKTSFGKLLHEHADVYPGPHTKIDYTFFSEEDADGGAYSYLQYDWDAHHVRKGKFTPENGMVDAGLLMYSLPHHREAMYSQPISRNRFNFKNNESFCTPSLNGEVCIVDGATWVLKENLDGEPSFFAPRPPLASTLENLSNSIQEDIKFRVPKYFSRGAGDTYFSGKILAKLSRILLITFELKTICNNPRKYGPDYVLACRNLTLPSRSQFMEALGDLRSGTQVWIDGTAETPFVYDDKWGGMCSCGCYFNGKTQKCDNKYPNCPAFSDPGLDFGHAFYNDHHFHQGYHIYAAATVAYFDHDWGKKYFEKVLLLVRDIANPSSLDEHFPLFRMKDWYLGNSWASGIARGYPNGRNQESSSESIAAYEAISIYGEVMANVYGGRFFGDTGKAKVARHVRDVGRLLTATELRSADTYWHVRQSGPKSGIYPPEYKPLVVGIMWNMMAQFQTWFGSAPHLAYGIQLLPLTPVAERRDSHDWVEQLYPSFAESCNDAPDCKEQGWGILQHAVLAELGHPDKAIKYAEALPKSAYTSAGGNGHSLTNTIWYYATRPETKPIKLDNVPTPASPTIPLPTPQGNNTSTFDCGCPDTCTQQVHNYPAGGFTCGARISWLMNHIKKSERDACSQVAGVEYTDMCAGCDPNRCTAPLVSPIEENKMCPPCTREQCVNGHLNRCPVQDAPFLCVDGANEGGCSMVPWKLGTSGGSNCNKCCQLTYQCQ